MYLQFCIRGYAMTQFSIALLLMEGCAFAYHNRKKMKKNILATFFFLVKQNLQERVPDQSDPFKRPKPSVQ